MMISMCRGSCADVRSVGLGLGVGAWFTGAVLDGADDANLAHHRPHVPDRLAQARDIVGLRTGTDPSGWQFMRQVHGSNVGIVDERTPVGSELRAVDVLVTRLPDRPLVVLSADCIPILAAGTVAIGAAHAGWRGLREDVPGALIGALAGLGERPEDVRIAFGPAIGPCCYEVGPEVIAAIAAIDPGAVTTTRSGSPSVDLRAAARTRLRELGVIDVQDAATHGDDPGAVDRSATLVPVCTACDAGWFSHRRDHTAGRQAGIVVRRVEGER